MSNAFLSLSVGRTWVFLPKIPSIELNRLSHEVLAVWEGIIPAKKALNCLHHFAGFPSHRTLLDWAGRYFSIGLKSHFAAEWLVIRAKKVLIVEKAFIRNSFSEGWLDLKLEGRRTSLLPPKGSFLR